MYLAIVKLGQTTTWEKQLGAFVDFCKNK